MPAATAGPCPRGQEKSLAPGIPAPTGLAQRWSLTARGEGQFSHFRPVTLGMWPQLSALCTPPRRDQVGPASWAVVRWEAPRQSMGGRSGRDSGQGLKVLLTLGSPGLCQSTASYFTSLCLRILTHEMGMMGAKRLARTIQMLATIIIILCFEVCALLQVTMNGLPCVESMPGAGSRTSWQVGGWNPCCRPRG